MKVFSYKDVSAVDWDNVCDQSSEAWLFHRSAWITLEVSHFKYSNRSFAIEDKGRIVAVQPLYFSDSSSGAADERLLHSGIHRHTGLACLNTLDSGLRRAVQAETMRHIHDVAHRDEAHRIQLNCQNLAPANRGASREEIPFWVLDHGYYLGLNCSPGGIAPAPGMATCNADQVIDLHYSEEQLFARLDESCRRAVRKALKFNLVFSISEANSVSRYFKLAQLSATRTGENLAPLSYFEDLWRSLLPQHRCAIAFVQHNGRDVAALLLGIDKGAATFLGGVSDPAALNLRVNDFMHFQAMLWLKGKDVKTYRLGPIFPEVPEDWPIARVSRFKRKFGGRSITIIQGSYFLSPEHYLNRGTQALAQRCSPSPAVAVSVKRYQCNPTILLPKADREAFTIIMACYGLVRGTYDFSETPDPLRSNGSVAFLACQDQNVTGLEIKHESDCQYLYVPEQKRSWWGRAPLPAYRTLLPHISFSGPDIEPILVTKDRRAVVAWQRNSNGYRTLLIGLDVVAEVIRYRQGNPAKVDEIVERSGFGFDFERPDYLYRDQIDPSFPHYPWADMLGFLLAECIAGMASAPLLEPLPEGLKGLVVLTGDDDQAYLEKYAEQLSCIGDLPITYFLVPQTRHTPETLRAIAKQVEIGVHPDALDNPENYDEICQVQTQFVRELSGQPVLTVRNHGFLNRGYLGHLSAWEKSDLIADVNCPGTDGTALNGSLLPMRVRRLDGSWSSHMSLLTAFGDGMLFGLKLSPRQSLRMIRRSVGTVENGRPGVLLFNLHPQNVKEARLLHSEVVKLARRPGWAAVRLDGFLKWFTSRNLVTAVRSGGGWRLQSPEPIESLVARVKTPSGWCKTTLSTVNPSGITVGDSS